MGRYELDVFDDAEIIDPCYQDPSFKGMSIEYMEDHYNDYVDKKAYPTLAGWLRYLKKNGWY